MLKEDVILKFFQKNDKLAMAFSGGSDSCCLSYIVKKKVNNIHLVFVATPLHSHSHIAIAKEKASILDLPLKIIRIEELSNNVKNNSKLRCYYCKKLLFAEIKNYFPDRTIIDGTNYSDTKEYRPGLKALEEMEIFSPFKDSLTVKEDIIDYLGENGLNRFIAPPSTCNATRIRYGIPLTKNILKLVEKTEKYLFEQGITFSRFRIKDKNSYTIETTPEFKNKIDATLLKNIKKKMAFNENITIEITNYRFGRFDNE